MEIGDLGEFWRLDEELLLGDETRDHLNFGFVQVKLAPVQLAVHIGVGEEDFRSAALDDYVENVRTLRSSSRDCVERTMPAFCACARS